MVIDRKQFEAAAPRQVLRPKASTGPSAGLFARKLAFLVERVQGIGSNLQAKLESSWMNNQSIGGRLQ